MKCATCNGAGSYASGPTDKPVEIQCSSCLGTGNLKLPFSEETFRVVTSTNLDIHVTEFLRQKGLLNETCWYEIEMYETLDVDSKPEYYVTSIGAKPIVKTEERTRLHGKLDEILDWMCAEGWVEPGRYLIENRT